MRNIVLLLLTFTVFGCNENPENFIQYIGGYWEIDEVRMPDGTLKDYGYNDTIDFFELKAGESGSRTKLRPNLDGTFSTNGDSEALEAVIENENLYLICKTPFDQWREKVVKASREVLVIENEQKIVYSYKKYQPLDLD
ncbi:MAG TPA: hypothetical protein PKL92_01070 [Aquaticitalea sp.]|nr:hypothetical protein [Aquaticitalea sp.]HNU58946.1 hypothetical protein [Aquaticitalea sp.]